ncbi:hypothetical protein GCM10017620_30900 [Brevundimonas intermedia]|uniref:Uncharacterized protein n=1 Tax=Brevundimonas intermedia TaxID=74315 RepID=A0ABQ5TCS4_9CAUL|nr:hypothetical protein GCM10017620_30900 [Brevundimonas intermedia]
MSGVQCFDQRYRSRGDAAARRKEHFRIVIPKLANGLRHDRRIELIAYSQHASIQPPDTALAEIVAMERLSRGLTARTCQRQ